MKLLHFGLCLVLALTMFAASHLQAASETNNNKSSVLEEKDPFRSEFEYADFYTVGGGKKIYVVIKNTPQGVCFDSNITTTINITGYNEGNFNEHKAIEFLLNGTTVINWTCHGSTLIGEGITFQDKKEISELGEAIFAYALKGVKIGSGTWKATQGKKTWDIRSGELRFGFENISSRFALQILDMFETIK